MNINVESLLSFAQIDECERDTIVGAIDHALSRKTPPDILWEGDWEAEVTDHYLTLIAKLAMVAGGFAKAIREVNETYALRLTDGTWIAPIDEGALMSKIASTLKLFEPRD